MTTPDADHYCTTNQSTESETQPLVSSPLAPKGDVIQVIEQDPPLSQEGNGERKALEMTSGTLALCISWVLLSTAAAIIPKELLHSHQVQETGPLASLRSGAHAVFLEWNADPRDEPIILPLATSHIETFNHPLFMSGVMAFAMSLAAPLFWTQLYISDGSCDSVRKTLRQLASCRVHACIAGMAACDVVGMWAIIFGLSYIPATLSALLFVGFGIVVNALVSTFILRQPQTNKQVAGMLLVTIGTLGMVFPSLLVPTSSDSGYADSKAHVALGVLVTLGGTFLQVGENVASELLMSATVGEPIHPMLLVGIEGTWAMVIYGFTKGVLIMADVTTGTDKQDMNNLLQSSSVEALLVISVFSTLTKNILSNYIILYLNSLWFALLKASRICITWIFQLILFYSWPGSHYGEAWEDTSWFLLACVMIIGAGLYVYNDVETHVSEKLDEKM